jgi:hypothetical protein
VTPGPDALSALIGALDDLASAVQEGRPDAFVAAEERLAATVSAICPADLVLISRNPLTRDRLDEARRKLTNCRAATAHLTR